MQKEPQGSLKTWFSRDLKKNFSDKFQILSFNKLNICFTFVMRSSKT